MSDAVTELRALAAKLYEKAGFAHALLKGLEEGGGGDARVMASLNSAARTWHFAGDMAERRARAIGRREKMNKGTKK